MSANDQILGDVVGEEVAANGNVDGAGAPQTTGTPAIDDAANASSQSVDSGAADNGAGGSAAEPADPSIPPADGTDLFSRLANEIIHHIIGKSDPVTCHGLRQCSKQLHLFGNSPPSNHPPLNPPLSRGEYIEFQKQLEIHSPRRLRSLYCPSCDTFKKPTTSRATFSDAHAVQAYRGRRLCVECGIASGYYDRRDVVIKKKKLFLCGGCKLLLPHDNEETVVAKAVFTKAFPWHNEGWTRAAEITIGSGKKRWCRSCRAVIANLGDSGAVKVKQVPAP